MARPQLAALVGQVQFTLISAPAGYGKTTLAAERLWQLPENQRAWLTLEAEDNDPARFIRYLSAALRPELLTESDTTSTWEPRDRLDALINALASSSTPVVMVLDEYELITSEAVHQVVSYLINHCPPSLRLVLTTRIDPPLPLARLLARNQLREIRTAQLKFSHAETFSFLRNAMRLSIGATEAATLAESTEGWAAGLQLAALSLQSGMDLSQIVGAHRHIADYLMAEVFERQPASSQAFLLHTSILPQLDMESCAVILTESEIDLPNPDAARTTLIQLNRENLFLIALDDTRHSYRYHALFAEFLRQRLHETQPQLALALHRKLGFWLAQQNRPGEAIDHFLAAQEFDLLVQVLDIASAQWIRQGEFTTLLTKYSALPKAFIRKNPSLCLWQAWALVLSDRLENADAWLQPAEAYYLKLHQRAQTKSPHREELLWNYRAGYGQATAIRATLALLQQNYALALQHADQALALLPSNDPVLPSAMTLIIGQAQLAQGHYAQAATWLQKASEKSLAAGHAYIYLNALLSLARAEALGKEPQQARKLAMQALRFANEQQVPSLIRLAEQGQASLANPSLAQMEPLNARELEILRLLEQGLPNQAIADELIIATSTVRWHVKHLYRKLGVHNRAQAAHRARELGLG